MNVAVEFLRKSRLRSAARRCLRFAQAAMSRLGLRRSEEALESEAKTYWTDLAPQARNMSHWRGEGGLPDDVFGELGRKNAEMFRSFAAALDEQAENLRIVDWGCGGGSNLVTFSPMAAELIGADVAQDSLDQARLEVEAIGRGDLRTVLIDLEHPESSVAEIGVGLDLFLCIYVFELLPSPEYGERLLRIARTLLRQGGMAMIQIKYDIGKANTASQRFSYRSNVARMTTYPIHEFWQLAESVGLAPRMVVLQPVEPLVDDERYAYFMLVNT